jgi:uncharacterized membrane protein YczE
MISARSVGAVSGLSTKTRLGRFLASSVLVAIGVALVIRAEVGVAPYDVLTTGLAEALGIRISVSFLVTAATVYAIGMALGGRAGWASVVGTFAITPLLDLTLDLTPSPDALAARIPMFVAGVLILVVAVSLVVSTELGPGPSEVFMLGIIARGVPVAAARWVVDALVIAVGAALGGDLGVGTIVFAFAFGPLLAVGFRVLRYQPPLLVRETVVAP